MQPSIVENRYIRPLLRLTPSPTEEFPWKDLLIIVIERLANGQGNKWRRNIAENFNRLSRVHERYRRQTDRRTRDDVR